jgi:tRNA(Ile)-lysidine synthetase-like protein
MATMPLHFVNNDVTSEIDRFLEDWISHPYYWFSKTNAYDTYISLKYQHLLTTTEWDIKNENPRHHLAFIILYDQVPRHVYRAKDQDDVIGIYLTKAITINSFMTKHFDLKCFNAVEWAFFQLPIRHSKNSNKIVGVIHDTWKRLKTENDEGEIITYLQFIKASYNRLPTDQSEYIETSVEENTTLSFELKDFIEYSDVLHNCPFIANNDESIEDSELYLAIEDFIIKHNIKSVIISLSGGVDSMICSYVLKKIQSKLDFHIIAVHIDYCNRTFKEYLFVRDWCIYIKIPLYTRHITEINRKDCMDYGMRNLYETYTKEVRFDTYRRVWAKHDSVSATAQVILGHNHDDCFENILMNISNKEKYMNLIGMTEEHTNVDIKFLRPILNFSKKNIYTFAYKYNIPYLCDSTPDWSQRGKIRDHLRPAFDKWFPTIVPAFFDLSEKLGEYEDIVYYVINQLLLNLCREQKDAKESIHCTLPCQRLILSTTIWNKIFEKLQINISAKSLQNFMHKVEDIYIYHKNTSTTTKKHVVTINKNTLLEFYFDKELMHVTLTITYGQLDQ